MVQKAKSRRKAPKAPASTQTISFKDRLERLELLRQSQALVGVGLRQIGFVGWTPAESLRVVVRRPDGAESPLLEMAVELAYQRVAEAFRSLGAEADAVEGSPPDVNRKPYAVIARRATPNAYLEGDLDETHSAELDGSGRLGSQPLAPPRKGPGLQ